MKLIINENPLNEELEIIINCKVVDEDLLKTISILKSRYKKIIASKNNSSFILDVDDILYFESVDKKTFAYTEGDVYETTLRLYEIEENYRETDLFRASKSTIINISKIKIIKPLFGGKVEVLLDNDEKQIVSRQYVPVLKKKISY